MFRLRSLAEISECCCVSSRCFSERAQLRPELREGRCRVRLPKSATLSSSPLSLSLSTSIPPLLSPEQQRDTTEMSVKSLAAFAILLAAMRVSAEVTLTGYAGAACDGAVINTKTYPAGAGELLLIISTSSTTAETQLFRLTRLPLRLGG